MISMRRNGWQGSAWTASSPTSPPASWPTFAARISVRWRPPPPRPSWIRASGILEEVADFLLPGRRVPIPQFDQLAGEAGLEQQITERAGTRRTGGAGTAQEEPQGARQLARMPARDLVDGLGGIDLQNVHGPQLDAALTPLASVGGGQGVVDALEPFHVPFQSIDEHAVQHMTKHLGQDRKSVV